MLLKNVGGISLAGRIKDIREKIAFAGVEYEVNRE